MSPFCLFHLQHVLLRFIYISDRCGELAKKRTQSSAYGQGDYLSTDLCWHELATWLTFPLLGSEFCPVTEIPSLRFINLTVWASGSPIIKLLAGTTSSGLENEQFCVSKDSGYLGWKQKGPKGAIKMQNHSNSEIYFFSVLQTTICQSLWILMCWELKELL